MAERTHGLHSCRIVALTLCSLLAFSGCGGPDQPEYPTVKLAGMVKVEGQSVEQGRIRFSPTKSDQAPAAEGVITAGQYTVENAPIGDVVVTFIGTKKTGRTVEIYGRKSEESVNVIPAKYSRGLPVAIDAGGNRDFDLTVK